MKILTGALTALMLEGTALAQDTTLTIYNDDLALVIDEREIDFENGRQVIELPNVSSRIESQTVTFLADGISIIEQNFDFDLLTPEKLMQKAVGGPPVTLVRVNPATGAETRQRAKVLSVNNGVIIEVDGMIEVLRDDNLPTRVIFDEVPSNLRASPTLSITVDSARRSRRDAQLTYLTHGFGWKADYIAVFDEEAGEMSFQGWTTLQNNTQTTFENAQVQLVAGSVNYTSSSQNWNNDWQRQQRRQQSTANRRAGSEAVGDQRLGDYYIYPLPEPTSVASNQTKQVSFIDSEKVTAAKRYEYRSYGFNTLEEPVSADVRIAFTNSASEGLGRALPEGTVRVYIRDSAERAQFVGEDYIEHTPGGSLLSVKTGDAFDVNVQPKLISRSSPSFWVTEYVMEYTVTNARPTDEIVNVRQIIGGYYNDIEILEESLTGEELAHGHFEWAVPVEAESETVLTFKVRLNSRW